MTGPHGHAPSRFPALTRGLNILVAGEPLEAGSAAEVLAHAALEDMLGQIREACRAGGVDAGLFDDTLYARGPCRFRLLLGAASRSDARIAEAAQAAGYELRRIGMEEAHARQAPENVRDAFALAHADMLILVWDGASANRIVDLLRQAAQQRMPVLWIDTGGAVRELLPARVNSSVLHHLEHRLLSDSLLRGDAGLFAAAVSPMSASLRWWINPLAAAAAQYRAPHGGDAGALRALRAYAEEGDADNALARHARGFDPLMAGLFVQIGQAVAGLQRMIAAMARTREQEERQRGEVAKVAEVAEACDSSGPDFLLPQALRQRRDWNESRASLAAGSHRSSVWMIYLLSALAVAAAVMGLLLPAEEGEGHALARAWPILEIGFLAAILFLLSWHRRSRWHKRWLGHRFLAEQLRYVAVTRPFLALPDCFLQPLFRVDPASGALGLRSAESWLLRRLLAAEGVDLDEGHDRMQAADGDSLATRLGREIRGQIDYHENNGEKLEHREKGLRFVMLLIFWLAVLVAGAHFIDAVHHQHWFRYAVLLTTAGPALAAGLHGISTKLEYGRIASASKETAQQLKELHRDIEEEDQRRRACAFPYADDAATPEDSLVLRLNAIEAARIMSSENEQWRALVNEQRAEVPA